MIRHGGSSPYRLRSKILYEATGVSVLSVFEKWSVTLPMRNEDGHTYTDIVVQLLRGMAKAWRMHGWIQKRFN